MTSPTFFTVIADFKSVVVDLASDVDADPTLGPITAKVTFTPQLNSGDVILATDASPRPIGYIAAPIVARIDTDGKLKLRVAPDGDRDDFANVAAFPATGNTAKVYFAINTQTFYRWNGSAYVETYPYAAVRLLANTPLLNLDGPLMYKVSFSDVVYNGAPGYIKAFTFEAPTYDQEVFLIGLMPEPGSTTAQGLNAPMLKSAYFNGDGELVFVNADDSLLEPIEIPDGVLVLSDNGDSTWSVQ
jgi:hypothetical protein